MAALTDRVMRAAVLAAERRGGRLDPPMVVVLDEAANICRIADLPDLYSAPRVPRRRPGHDPAVLPAGRPGVGRGRDGRAVVRRDRQADRARASTTRSSPATSPGSSATTTSRTRSVSRGNGGRSTSTSVRREPILPPERIRELPRGRALLLATGTRPAIVRLTPWYAGPRRAEIGTAVEAATARMTDAARDTAA